MDRMRIVPRTSKGNPYTDLKERNLIYFNVRYNHHRDLCTDTTQLVADREEWAECRAVLCFPDSYCETGAKTQLILACHGAGRQLIGKSILPGALTVFLTELTQGMLPWILMDLIRTA